MCSVSGLAALWCSAGAPGRVGWLHTVVSQNRNKLFSLRRCIPDGHCGTQICRARRSSRLAPGLAHNPLPSLCAVENSALKSFIRSRVLCSASVMPRPKGGGQRSRHGGGQQKNSKNPAAERSHHAANGAPVHTRDAPVRGRSSVRVSEPPMSRRSEMKFRESRPCATSLRMRDGRVCV